MPDRIVDDYQMSDHAWMVDICSHKSNNIYTVHVFWDDTKADWAGLTCTCDGFKNRGACRHLKDVVPLLKEKYTLKKPARKTPSLIPKYWMQCALCDCVLFYIKPPIASESGAIVAYTTIVVCSKCGKHYEMR